MNLSSLFPPTIVSRLLEDLGAVADAARRLPELERSVLQRVDTLETAPELAAMLAVSRLVAAGGPLDTLLDRVAAEAAGARSSSAA